MKKIISIIILSFFSAFIWAQKGVINNGSKIIISDNAYFKIEGTSGHYINKNNANIDLEGTLSVQGDWDNQNTSNNIFLNQSSGHVVFNGTAEQTIWGSTYFNNLDINNSHGVLLDNAIEANNITIANDGLLTGGGQDIKVYGNWNSALGDFAPGNNHVYFMGDADQQITSKTDLAFYNLTINNGHKLIFNNTLAIDNLYVTSGIAESSENADIDTKLVYNGTDAQQTGDEWPATTTVNVQIVNNSIDGVTLSDNKQIATGKSVSVTGNLKLNNSILSGLGSLIIQDGATISTKHSLGLNGNITLSGTVTLSSLANYTFDGDLAQVTGVLLPYEVNNLTINNNAGDVVLSHTGHTIVNGNFESTKGSLVVNPTSQLTVKGNTTLSNALALVLKSDVSGTASFIDNGTISGTGTAKSERYLATGSTTGWYVTPSVSNGNVAMFDAPPSGVWFYNSSTSGWQQLSSGSLNIMTGYVTKYPDNKVIGFTGSLNTDELSRTNLVRTTSPNNFGWNLVGNPYPSAFDWDAASKVNLNNAIYFRKSNGSMATYVNSIGTPFGTTGIIPPMQAFWVQVNINFTTGSLTFNNTGRLHDALPLYKETVTHELIRLESDNGQLTDETVIYFNIDAQPSFNGDFDAHNMASDDPNQPDIFSYTDTHEELTTKAVPFNNAPLSVPLGYKSQVIGMQIIKAFDFDNIDSNVSIYLEDLLLNVVQNLRQNDTYYFNHALNNTTDRFVLHFNYVASENGNITDTNENLAIYTSKHNIFISFPSDNKETYNINVFNLLGQVIYKETLTNPESLHKVQFDGADGNYIVNVYANKNVWNKKVSLFR